MHILCAVKHITLSQARERARLTQLQLEELSGVDRTRISKMESESSNPTIDTVDKLDRALRAARDADGRPALRRNERLTFSLEALAS